MLRPDASEFTDFDFTKAPRVSERRITKQGMLVICLKDDGACLQRAERYVTPHTQRINAAVAHRVKDLVGPIYTFVVIAIPPKTLNVSLKKQGPGFLS